MFTCLSCQVAFAEPEKQRTHFHSDWHRYNLKRKVADLPVVSAESFQERVIAQRAKPEDDVPKSIYCEYCKKVFVNPKTFENHVSSKKHLEKVKEKEEMKNTVQKKYPETINKPEDDDEDDDLEVEEVDSDEWEGEAIPLKSCLFCEQSFKSVEKNMKHMTTVHSFFIPDLQFCTNVNALLTYLGEKVGCGMQCLWCNERSKQFWTVDGVQSHMKDKGHCMMKLEGVALLEYSDYYDYSSSYPDADAAAADEEFEPEVLQNDGYELTLPSGVTIGHRSLFRYYKQRLNPNRGIVVKNSTSMHSKMMAQYKALGWKGATKADIVKKARDLNFMKRIQSKQYMRLGVKANKFQPHLRPQVIF